jgi:hypothetical protein
MAAGLGFKNFNTGDVLSASDVNGYLMQGVLVFDSAAARNAAITSPQEGQFAYTKDTNGLWYYDGAAWVASGATGDIEGVTAGTGISGGGTSGTVTITNSMATAIDAKGDLVAGTGADTFARLGVGTNGQVLTADSAETTGLKWATAAGGGGGMTLLSTTSLSGTSTSVSITPTGYVDLKIFVVDWSWNSGGDGNLSATLNSNTTAGAYNGVQTYWRSVDSNSGVIGAADSNISMSYYDWGQDGLRNIAVIDIWGVNETSAARAGSAAIHGKANSGNDMSQVNNFMFDTTDAISSIQIRSNRTFTGGTILVYGVK